MSFGSSLLGDDLMMIEERIGERPAKEEQRAKRE